MEDLQGRRRSEDPLVKGIGKEGIGRQAQARTDALAADGDHVAERVVESRRLGGELDAVKQPFDELVDLGLCHHIIQR